MSLDPTTGRARLVIPRRAALKPALAWAEGKTAWIEAQRANLPQPIPFVSGLCLTVADEPMEIRWSEGPRRRIDATQGILSLQGPQDTVARRVEAWLRSRALALLETETRAIAAQAGVTVDRVAIGDARGRWGSCSSSGTIRYSWRLILAPGFVRRATVAHEVAHRVHMNHSAAFHALAAELLGEDPAPAHAWLRAYGASLHWFGRSS
nr:YgjP-like metallopeptidase domain-containing protein [Sphingomonas jinjuensis]